MITPLFNLSSLCAAIPKHTSRPVSHFTLRFIDCRTSYVGKESWLSDQLFCIPSLLTEASTRPRRQYNLAATEQIKKSRLMDGASLEPLLISSCTRTPCNAIHHLSRKRCVSFSPCTSSCSSPPCPSFPSAPSCSRSTLCFPSSVPFFPFLDASFAHPRHRHPPFP